MTADRRPSFLQLPVRPAKPRKSGLTHVIDKGCTLASLHDVLGSVARWIDVWKFGWGSSYLDPCVRPKVAALKTARVLTCTGGTLMEIAWQQGQTEGFFDFALDIGFDCVEVSDGATAMPLDEKRRLIARARSLGFVVMAEVGSKDPARIASPDDWLEEIEGDVEAGAHWIVAEGRESGTAGLYDGSGGVRQSLVHTLARSPHARRIIYEAPQRAQQSFLLRLVGGDVNIGNVQVDEVMSLEALRLGLRADSSGTVGEQAHARHERDLDVRV